MLSKPSHYNSILILHLHYNITKRLFTISTMLNSHSRRAKRAFSSTSQVCFSRASHFSFNAFRTEGPFALLASLSSTSLSAFLFDLFKLKCHESERNSLFRLRDIKSALFASQIVCQLRRRKNRTRTRKNEKRGREREKLLGLHAWISFGNQQKMWIITNFWGH